MAEPDIDCRTRILGTDTDRSRICIRGKQMMRLGRSVFRIQRLHDVAVGDGSFHVFPHRTQSDVVRRHHVGIDVGQFTR